MVALAWLSTSAPGEAQTRVVTDPATEGGHPLLPGRDGDAVSRDGWALGVLPLDTVLAGGLHELRVEGPSGSCRVAIDVTPAEATVSRPGT